MPFQLALSVGTFAKKLVLFLKKTVPQTKRQGKEKGLNTSFSRIQANLKWSR